MPVVHLEIEGRVQGVGYRWYAKQCAQRRGIGGWAMNRSDGCVEVAAKGSDEDLDRFLIELRSGPPGAEVAAIRNLPLISESELGDSFITR